MKFKVGDIVRIGPSTGPGHDDYLGKTGIVVTAKPKRVPWPPDDEYHPYEVEIGGKPWTYKEDELILAEPAN